MNQSLSSRYRYSQWQLIKSTAGCVLWLLLGIAVLSTPIGKARWAGLFIIGYGLVLWVFRILPRWKHVIILDEDHLQIGSAAYAWSRFDTMRIERTHTHRSIHLVGENGQLDIWIKDELPHYDELAKDCFIHMNRCLEQPESSQSQGNCDS